MILPETAVQSRLVGIQQSWRNNQLRKIGKATYPAIPAYSLRHDFRPP
jgi:hypothetical protein